MTLLLCGLPRSTVEICIRILCVYSHKTLFTSERPNYQLILTPIKNILLFLTSQTGFLRVFIPSTTPAFSPVTSGKRQTFFGLTAKPIDANRNTKCDVQCAAECTLLTTAVKALLPQGLVGRYLASRYGSSDEYRERAK